MLSALEHYERPKEAKKEWAGALESEIKKREESFMTKQEYAQCAKGQLVSKGLFGIFKSTKETNKTFVSISVLAYKKWLIQKSEKWIALK